MTRGWRRYVTALDDAGDRAVDRLRGHPVADRLFYGASALGDHGLVWLIVGTARGISARRRRAALRLAIGLGIESAVVNGVIKSLFRRHRPVWDAERPFRLRKPRTSSFPSGHASSGFFAAALLSEDDPLWPLYYATAVVVASSRMYVKIHHASDVVGGAVLGAVTGRLVRRAWPISDRKEAWPPSPSPGTIAAPSPATPTNTSLSRSRPVLRGT